MEKEQQILNFIKLNPYISQQELADEVGLSRPAVANYIKRLIASGDIKGRAYILNDHSGVTCIGGANVDRKSHALQDVRMESSNPVITDESLGGVARNVAENLVRLDLKPTLATFVGQDKEGAWLTESAYKIGIDTSEVTTLPQSRTGTYTALIDRNGELVVSMADMEIYNKVSEQLIEQKWQQYARSDVIFLDTNISESAIHAVIRRSKSNQKPLFLDPVSSIKAKKLPGDLSGVHTIIPNKEEAEELSGITINSANDLGKACHELLRRGVKQVVITLGEEGIYYCSNDEEGKVEAIRTEVADVTGAGDAFTAGIIYGFINGQSLQQACRFGLACATLTLQSSQSCSEDLSTEKINTLLKELS
ncbi:carbohydrate kinase [Alkalibacillus haloalkaliphilus]|uniref:Carbohydrate kinase n=1 Tax=Alkalibacillus haloalkaliphilus TaxID=94136 RepID=A0A511W0C4_9BACI|nr:carbohydrate kinase [Alkalibacillus haloalkaliphilus]GEN44539.1 carbohydrate kinase [Alkalibacillus haloalkaliphilus]